MYLSLGNSGQIKKLPRKKYPNKSDQIWGNGKYGHLRKKNV